MKYKIIEKSFNFWKNYKISHKIFHSKDLQLFLIKNKNKNDNDNKIYIDGFDHENFKVEKTNYNKILNYNEKKLEKVIICINLETNQIPINNKDKIIRSKIN